MGKAIRKEPVESEFLLDNVEALAAGESGYDTCLGSGNVTCSTGEKVECVIRPFGLD
ncbi:NVEALA domain-containing protein [Phocaeicola dorei]|uniref:NVEALA domain-containing protein n=1 Tax=Phocaeicola dorei TaxID=357276 RepID=UPI0034A192CB